tara:strand:+ start:3217 stop:3825 length:609 start_codon:yes stop_codon:yes gene_type:complete
VSEYLHQIFGRERLECRAVSELIGLAHGMLADGKIDQNEAEYLQKWLVANEAVTDSPVIVLLRRRVDQFLADGILDEDEALDLFTVLSQFTGNDYELGELQKSTSLPLDTPPPAIEIPGKSFCFTGTFAYGSRRECESVISELGGNPGPMRKTTDYLIIGVYATGSWAHSSFGRKIEKALAFRETGSNVAIISEEHWATQIQ